MPQESLPDSIPNNLTRLILLLKCCRGNPVGEKTSKQIVPFEAGMAGSLVILVSFLGVQEKGPL